MTKRAEGEAELVIYFESHVPDDVKVTFIRYVHEHLGSRAVWDLIERKFASEELQLKVNQMDAEVRFRIDNESRELILVGHTYAIAGEAGQIYRQYTNSDHGIDGEIEFKDNDGKASGKRLYLQLKSGDSYLYKRKRDGAEIFTIRKKRWAEYWRNQAYPVMLIVRTLDGQIRWMNISEYLQKRATTSNRIVFQGERFNARSVVSMREQILSHS
jgi:hypothetical protein